jgi:hypothetical protein
MLVLVMAVRMVAGLHTTIVPLTFMAAVEAVRAVREAHGAKTNSQAEKNGARGTASVLAVRTAAVEGDRAHRLVAVMAHQEVYELSGVSVKTVRHDPFRTPTAPRNLR